MTVEELIRELSGYNKDAEVIMSSDPEGNRFSVVGETGQDADTDHNRVIIWPGSEVE